MIKKTITIEDEFELGNSWDSSWKASKISDENKQEYINFFKNEFNTREVELNEEILIISKKNEANKKISILSFIVFLGDPDLIINNVKNPFYIHVSKQYDPFSKEEYHILLDKFNIVDLKNERVFNGFLPELSKLITNVEAYYVSDQKDFKHSKDEFLSFMLSNLSLKQNIQFINNAKIEPVKNLEFFHYATPDNKNELLLYLLDKNLIRLSKENIDFIIRTTDFKPEIANKIYEHIINNKESRINLINNIENFNLSANFLSYIIEKNITDIKEQIYKNKNIYSITNVDSFKIAVNHGLINIESQESINAIETNANSTLYSNFISEKLGKDFIKKHIKDYNLYPIDWQNNFNSDIDFAIEIKQHFKSQIINTLLKQKRFKDFKKLIKSGFNYKDIELLYNNFSTLSTKQSIENILSNLNLTDKDKDGVPLIFAVNNDLFNVFFEDSKKGEHPLLALSEKGETYLDYHINQLLDLKTDNEKLLLIKEIYPILRSIKNDKITNQIDENNENFYHKIAKSFNVLLKTNNDTTTVILLKHLSNNDDNFLSFMLSKNNDGQTPYDICLNELNNISYIAKKEIKNLLSNKRLLDEIIRINNNELIDKIISNENFKGEEFIDYITMATTLSKSSNKKSIKM